MPKFTTSPKGSWDTKGRYHKTNFITPFIPGAAAMDTNMYVPHWFYKMFPGSTSSSSSERRRALGQAAIATNAIGSSLLAVGAVAGIRFFMDKMHRKRLAGMASDNPANKLTSHLNTLYTFDPEGDAEKAKAEEERKRLKEEARMQRKEERKARREERAARRQRFREAGPEEQDAMTQEAMEPFIQEQNKSAALLKIAGMLKQADPPSAKGKAGKPGKKQPVQYETSDSFAAGGPVSAGLKYTVAGLAPTLAALTAAGLANMYFSRQNGLQTLKDADKRLAVSTKLRDKLIYARAANAKGKLTKEELDALNKEIQDAGIAQHIVLPATPAEEGQDKQAAGALEMAWTGISMAAASLLALSFLGSYQYTSARDPRNIQYKAIKKGLKEYAKTKAATTPVYTVNPGSDPFAKLDAEDKAEPAPGMQEAPKAVASPRNDYAVDGTASYKPISVTL